MVVVSSGMQKSGSAYIYNVINDLLIGSGKADARAVKEKYQLANMRWHNNNLFKMDWKSLWHLVKISKKENTFAVKTHSEPTSALNLFSKMGWVKIVYIYRDPRDVLLSAIDHGKKILAQGEDHTFAQMVEFDDALKNVKDWVDIYMQYQKNSKVLSIKYEDLMQQPQETVRRVCTHLGIKASDEAISEVLFKYNKDNPKAQMKALHFNKAKINRYTEDLSEEKQRIFKEELGNEIKTMGYSI
ncbi:MAG: sulfotransferase domain-containing protein [Bacteroidota bacterium]